MQAILLAGKQLQRLHIEDKDVDVNGQSRSVQSVLLRKLILTASSSGVIGNSAKLLSTLKKEAADKGDLPNLFIISSGQFPEVCLKLSSSQFVIHVVNVILHCLHVFSSLCFVLHPLTHVQIAKARSLVQAAKEKLELLISLYRKQLRMNNLEFMSVSGTTHLIEVVHSKQIM